MALPRMTPPPNAPDSSPDAPVSGGKKRMVFHSLSSCAGCGCSGNDFASPNVEAFEITGELYCEDCADEAIQAASEDEQ